MVVVVVTAGGTVLCFDHNLRLLWSRMLWPDGVPRGAYLSEATVHVSPRAIADHDRGSVIVGLTLESGGDTDDGVVDLAIDDDDPWVRHGGQGMEWHVCNEVLSILAYPCTSRFGMCNMTCCFSAHPHLPITM